MRCLLLLLSGLCVSAAPIALNSDRLKAEIDPGTGALVSLADRMDGRHLAESSYDTYVLGATLASEAEDVCESAGDNAFRCSNPKIAGLRIEKSYSVLGRYLTKRVAFATSVADLGFLKYSTATRVPADFWRHGYLNNPARHVIRDARPYIPVASITEETQMFDYNPQADHHWVIFTNPAMKRGLAQYRFKVDDQFVHPLTSYAYEPGLYYSPKGWRMAVAAKWLSVDRPALSAEVRWHLFDGDHLQFHKEYSDLLETQFGSDSPPPQWMRSVKGIVTWDYGRDPESKMDVLKQWAENLTSGYLMVLIRGVFHNTRAYLADPIPGPRARIPAAELKARVEALQRLSPRIKVGPITWQWAFGNKDPVFREHPEWTVHDASGKPHYATSGWEHEGVFSQLLTPEAREFVLRQFRGMVNRYGFDFVYMDSGQGGITLLDYDTKYAAQDYDWEMLYKGIRDAIRLRGGGLFLNGVPNLFSQYSDFGYYEGFNPPRDHWQAKSDRLLLAKLYQKPIWRRAIPLYWDYGGSSKLMGAVKYPAQATSKDSYPKACYTLALKPGGFDNRGEFSPILWPVFSALSEIEEAKLVLDAEMEPAWWRQETDIEAYALRLGKAALLTAYNHGKSASATLRCRLQPLGFDPAKPVHVWRFDPKTASQMELENSGAMSEKEVQGRFQRNGEAPMRAVEARFVKSIGVPEGRFHYTLPLESEQVVILMLTQADHLTYAKEDGPTHFLLPATGAASESTVRADRPLPESIAKARRSTQPDVRRKEAAVKAKPTGRPFFGDAVIHEFIGKANVGGGSIQIWPDGGVEATGLSVTTTEVNRPADGGPMEIVVTYYRLGGRTQEHVYSLAEVPAGTRKEILLDLNQFAPEDWTKRCRLILKADVGFIRLTFNSPFQLY